MSRRREPRSARARSPMGLGAGEAAGARPKVAAADAPALVVARVEGGRLDRPGRPTDLGLPPGDRGDAVEASGQRGPGLEIGVRAEARVWRAGVVHVLLAHEG